jgi:trans-aconitate 2-methyltransferase
VTPYRLFRDRFSSPRRYFGGGSFLAAYVGRGWFIGACPGRRPMVATTRARLRPRSTLAVVSDWDAATYDRIANPQARWGERLLDRLPLHGDEIVMDAGCGTGRVTERLAERLPYGHVVAVDRSPAMLAIARARLARFGARVTFVEADLARLPQLPAVDAVISSATFHWIPDHDALFTSLARVVRSRGRLAAECGGTGNIANVVDALARLGKPELVGVSFPDPDATRHRLHEAGFPHARVWLRPDPVTFDSDTGLHEFLRAVIPHPQLHRMPVEDREAFIAAVAAELPERRLHYVRLEIDASRG